MKRTIKDTPLKILHVWTSTALTCAVLVLAGAHTAQAGINVWTSNGPEGGNVSALAIDPLTPGTLYAGTNSGVFKSTDAGSSWSAASMGLQGTRVVALAIDPMTPRTLYAGTTTGVFKSTDGATSWQGIGAGLEGVVLSALIIDPLMPATLYARTDGGGVFKSTNAGATWSGIRGSIDLPALALAIDPTVPATLYVGTGRYDGTVGYFGATLKSTDGGENWDAVTEAFGPCAYVTALAVDPITPRTVYAVQHSSGICKSTDAGATWTYLGALNTSYPVVNVLVIDPVTPGVLYAGTGGRVFKSTDAGATWSAFSTGFAANPNVNALVIEPKTPTKLYAATDDGVFSIQQLPVSCVGDCDGNGQGTIDELVTLMKIALGKPLSCPSGVPAGATVDVSLILQAVNNDLNGCPSSDLYVATSGDLNGDGTISNPYRRITDAVARARAERQRGAIPAEVEIGIHVAPGTYVGSFDATQLQAHPEYEVVPIILNVPQLAVLGATVLVRDDGGLPTAATPESETILEPDKSLDPNQYLFVVTRTADGIVGSGVTVDGFTLDGREGAYPGAAVFVDRVSGFRISNNLVQHTAFGILTRLASGTIEGNLLADNGYFGSLVTGGSLAHPATIFIHANRATRSQAHGFGNSVGGYVKLRTDPGQNTLALLEPIQTVFDRTNPVDVQNIPDTLTATLTGNDASDNSKNDPEAGIGIRLAGIFPDFDYSTADATQPVTSVLTANVSGNTCEGNGSYGVVIEAGDTPRTEPRRFVQTLKGSFEGNTLVGNGRAAALFTFTYWRVAVGLNSLSEKKFAEESSYEVTDGDGELTGFDYDNPVMDPLTGTVLNNTLTMNGVEAPSGKHITR